ncbi:MAG: hypothetical protein FWE27_00850 [Defluviitaleaceae bacterium]|nr:hypothetical protein [Defluviitaleaceae bacterium]
MEYSASENDARRRLAENCQKIERFIEHGEVLLFTKYLLITLDYGLKHGKEVTYAVNTIDDTLFSECESGSENEVEGCELDIKIKGYDYNYGSLSMFHNHPWSIAPSPGDYDIFIRNRKVKNISVCGHIGNLYFMQKNQNLMKATEALINEIQKELHNAFLDMITFPLEKDEYDATGIYEASEDIQKKYYKLIQEDFFMRVRECGIIHGFLCVAEE